jgi:arylsulfatase A-like enzyme
MRKLIFLLVLALPATVRAATPPQPNILLVLIDDMGYGDLSCYGGTRVKTPNIDKLAAEGIRFTHFYVNAPICSPSRVALTTGQYPNRWRITSYLDTRAIDKKRDIADWLDPAAPSLARSLQAAGYYTAHVGKWHMGGQRDVGDAPHIRDYGFADSLTSFEGLGERVLPKFHPHPDGKPFVHEPTDMNAKLGDGPIHWVDRWKVTQAFVDHAIEQIDHAAKAHKPFYVNLWPDDVHSPCQAPPGGRGDDSPEANYLGVVKELDRQLGRAFDFVRANPELRDNTIILVMSDNGPERGLGETGGLRGDKGQLYEGGIREPLIVWSAKIAADKRGSTNRRTVLAGMDFAPSMLALTGTPADQTAFDGLDMHRALLGESDAPRETAVMWVRPPDRPGPKNAWPDLAIRDGKYKLLVHRDGSRAELFDIDADVEEKHNLTEEMPDRARRLADRVIAWDRSIPARPVPRD